MAKANLFLCYLQIALNFNSFSLDLWFDDKCLLMDECLDEKDGFSDEALDSWRPGVLRPPPRRVSGRGSPEASGASFETV